MSNDIYTEDPGQILQSARERGLLLDILQAWEKGGLPYNFSDVGVKPAFNRNSGYVFLVNSECQCAMPNSDTGNLEIFHRTPYEGREGFLSDLLLEYKPEELYLVDAVYLREQAEYELADLPAAWGLPAEEEV